MQQRPILTYLTQEKLPDVTETDEMAQVFAAKNSSKEMNYPDGFEEMLNQYKDENQVIIQAIGLSFKYMEDMMMAEVTIPFASFRPYHGDTSDAFLNINTNMVLDFAS